MSFFFYSGLELLLSDVYDTTFSGLDVGRSFSQSNMYRILQRRYFAVQLALTGQFRCEFKYISQYISELKFQSEDSLCPISALS